MTLSHFREDLEDEEYEETREETLAQLKEFQESLDKGNISLEDELTSLKLVSLSTCHTIVFVFCANCVKIFTPQTM